MKTHPRTLLAFLVCFPVTIALAQTGPRSGAPGPKFGAAMAKLFGDNSNFSANVEMRSEGSGGDSGTTVPGRLTFSDGKSRFEMDMSEMKAAALSEESVARLKSMGMEKLIHISRPDNKVGYTIYPGLQAYAELPIMDPASDKPESELKMTTTELGKETFDSHPCIKNKAVVTDSEGKEHESVLWNATDLKKFPIKIEQKEQGMTTTMIFKDVNLAKPDASLFDPPSSFTRYTSVQSMMQQEMMKKMGGGQGLPKPPGGGQ
jgi:hypothetical protein